MGITPASSLPSGGFDAARWLNEWAAAGGIYLLTGDMLRLQRSIPLDRDATLRLDALRAELMRSNGGIAIGELLRRRREGDLR